MLKCCVLPLSSECLRPRVKCFGKSELLKIALENLQFVWKSNSLLPHTRNCHLGWAHFFDIHDIILDFYLKPFLLFYSACSREHNRGKTSFVRWDVQGKQHEIKISHLWCSAEHQRNLQLERYVGSYQKNKMTNSNLSCSIIVILTLLLVITRNSVH